MRRLLPALILLLLVPTVSGLSFEVRDSSCQADEQPMFSMSNRTNAHAGAPGVFEDHTGQYTDGQIVCGQDTGTVRIAQTCQTIENSVLSFHDPESGQSHLSTEGERSEYNLCTERLATSVWRQCPSGSEPIVSIHGPVEDHIAEPGHYPWQICGASFENATLAYNFTLSGNQTFVNNEGTGAAGSTLSGDDGPLYAITQNGTLMSGLVGDNTQPQQVSIEDRSGRSVVTHTIDRPSSQQWFVPLTTGDQFDIERRLSLIEAGTFLTQFNPNFAFTLADEALIRVGLELQNIDIIESIGLGPGLYTFNVQNVGTAPDGTPRVNISVQ